MTFTGTGFGSQSTGAVWLGSMAANVVSWTDTQVIATVASGSLSGIARIEQNGAWSNAEGFTVPGGGGNSLTPAMINMVVGDTHTIQATNASGQPVTGLTWTSSNTSIVSLSTDDPPILTALAPGHVTITAGTGSADVTVWALGVLPNGTVLWSNPGDGSGVQQILPAVPSQAGVADVFALQNDGKIQAIKSDGTVAWTSDVSAYVVGGFFNGVLHTTADWGTDDADVAGAGVRPNFQGGITFRATNCNDDALRCALVTLDGGTGQVVSTYTPAGGNQNFGDFLIHTDGTIFNLEMDGNDDLVVTGIDSSSGTAKFSALLYQSSVDERSVSDGGGQQDWIGPHANPIVAGDGYAYWPWIRVVPGGSLDQNGNVAYSWTEHVMLFRVNSSGSSDNIDLMDWISSTDLINHSGPTDVSITTNADQGVIVNWYTPTTGVGGMAVTTGTSVAVVSTPSVPGQATAAFNILQAQDGSFVGSVGVGDPNNPQYNMVAFDASGNVHWMVSDDQPQIATDDGGVIGQSGVTYDQNGNATGRTPLLTQSWTGNEYVDGDVEQIAQMPAIYAVSFAAAQGGNPSGSKVSVMPYYFPQQGLLRLAHTDLTASPTCNLLLQQFATMGHVSVATLVSQLQATANRARNFVYDGPSSNTILDPIKFPEIAFTGVNTVGQWFAYYTSNGYADGLSQVNGDAEWFRFSDWLSWFMRSLTPRFISNKHLNYYAMGTLMHETLHKQTVGGGFTHPQMQDAIAAVFPNFHRGTGLSLESEGIGHACFSNLQ